MKDLEEFEQERFRHLQLHERQKIRFAAERLAHQVVMWQAVQAMNEPLYETMRLINELPVRKPYTPPKSEALKACIGWVLVMTAATAIGWGLGYISKYWF